MQILYIQEESQIINFLSGMLAEAIMPNSNMEFKGYAGNNLVTVICSGDHEQYPGTILSVDSGYLSHPQGQWLDLKFLVQRNDFGTNAPLLPRSGQRPAEA